MLEDGAGERGNRTKGQSPIGLVDASVVCGVLAAALLAGCSGAINSSGPANVPITNSETVPTPKDEVWKKLVAGLPKQLFAINNLDKESGLVNVSYNGDPERYVDCGMIHSAMGGGGERDYNFPASRAVQEYQVTNGFITAQVHRKMSLEGRMSILVQSVDANTTNVSVNTKYILTRVVTVDSNPPLSDTTLVNFNTGQSAVFPVTPGWPNVPCHATGALERVILEIVKLTAG
ncbi:MAG TPA: hypothetical protein VEJ16_05630 [Alphaproteobacteria bacterium]|nr:hypothetical protein [Alphaproteobacteria bacterium]